MNDETRWRNLEHIERTQTRVMVVTRTGRFEGTFHHAPGSRLSDAVQNLSGYYLLLTDVTIPADADLGSTWASFLLLSRDHISFLVPIDDEMPVDDDEAA